MTILINIEIRSYVLRKRSLKKNIHLASVSSIKCDSRKRDSVSSLLYPSSLDSSSSMLFLFLTLLPRFDLSSLWYYRGFKYILALKVVRSLSLLQRVTVLKQSSHGHHRYLPSGINQLNARLLDASASLKPILLTFLFYLPILFLLAPMCSRGGRYPVDLPIINSTRLSTLHTLDIRHSRSSLPSSLTTLLFRVTLTIAIHVTRHKQTSLDKNSRIVIKS